MSGSFRTRHLGTLCRLYKNSSNVVIAIDSVSIVTDTTRIHKISKFHQSAYPVHTRELFYLGVGDRIIDTILVFGDFDEINEDGGNYSSATWKGNGDTGDAIISFSHLPQLGGTV